MFNAVGCNCSRRSSVDLITGATRPQRASTFYRKRRNLPVKRISHLQAENRTRRGQGSTQERQCFFRERLRFAQAEVEFRVI